MTRARRRCGKWSVVASAAALAALAGCDEASPLSRAIDQANVKLTALTPGGASPASPAYKAKIYNEVATALNAQSANGTPGEKAAAQLLIAQAQLGLGDNPAAAAAEIERNSLSALTRLESALALWRNHNAVAGAAQKFDPSPEVAEIEAANQEKDTAVVQETARRAQVDAKVSELRTEAASLVAQAREKHAREAEIVRQIPNETAVRGEQLLREARSIAREADALEARAAELDAQAAKIAPQAQEIQLAIDRLNNQKSLLAKAREEVARRAAWHSEQARQARAQAEQAAQDADALVKELVEIREHADDAGGGKPCERAAELYDRAATTAASAAREANYRANAKLIEGAARQALGDLHSSNAQGLARAAETLAAVSGAAPALPNSARYTDLLAQTKDQQKTALDAATEAYTAAVEAYKGAGAQGDARDRLDRVQQKLARIVKVSTDGKVDLMAQIAGSEDGSAGGDDPAPTGTIDADSPLASIDEILGHLREGRFAEVITYVHVTDAENQRVLDAAPAFAESFARVDTASRGKFGSGLIELAMTQAFSGFTFPSFGGIAAEAQGGGEGLSAMWENLSASQFRAEVDGDTAKVHAPDADPGADPMPMRLVDGRWLIDLSEIEAQIATQPDAAKWRELIVFALPLAADFLDGLAADVEAGTYSTAEAMLAGASAKGMGLTAQVMGKMTELGLQPPGGLTPPPGRPGGG